MNQNYPILLPSWPLAPLALFGLLGLAAGSYVLGTYGIPAIYYVLVLTGTYIPSVGFFVYLLLWGMWRRDHYLFGKRVARLARAAREFDSRGVVSVECASEAECRELLLQEKAWQQHQLEEAVRRARRLF